VEVHLCRYKVSAIPQSGTKGLADLHFHKVEAEAQCWEVHLCRYKVSAIPQSGTKGLADLHCAEAQCWELKALQIPCICKGTHLCRSVFVFPSKAELWKTLGNAGKSTFADTKVEGKAP
jgi:hypothetical protein